MPRPPPRRGDRGVFPGPFLLDSVQLGGCLIGRGGAVNSAQIGGDGLAIFLGAKVRKMAHQMHDAGLDRGPGEGGGDGIGKAFQPVHDRDQNVLNL